MKLKTKDLVKQAIIAAVYRVLTQVLPVPQYGNIQFRLSEVMTLLVVKSKKCHYL